MSIYTVQGPDGKTYEIEGPEGATAEQLGAVITGQAAVSKAAPSDLMGDIKQGAGNLAAGAVRGAGSIGATLLAPMDMAKDAIAGKGLSLESNRARRADMDSALGQLGAETDSWMYQGGKLGGEIAGTAGAGGLLAKGASAVPGLAKAAPSVINALKSSGMTTGLNPTGAGAKVADMALRMGAGGVVGGASAGLVNPEDAGMGAAIGSALPPVVQGMGALGKKAGEAYAARLAKQLQEFNQKAPINETVKKSIEAGYVIPPNMVKPSFANQVIESVSGKQATQQIASGKNAEITDALVRKSVGLADDAPLSSGTLENLRKTAGGAYKEVADLSPAAAADLEALKTTRNEAQGWFKAYNRSARPDDLAKAKEFRVAADQLEAALESHAASAGKPELIPALKDARKQIAKTYTIGRALNDASGTVDARVLGRMSEKGLPLSDGLDVVGKFGSAFPTIAKTAQQTGSPGAHNLKAMASALMGGGGMAALGPAGLAAAAVPFVAPPVARSMMFRQGAQKALVKSSPEAAKAAKLAELLQNPEVQQLLLRSAPAIASQGQ